jgi:glutaredoxin
MSDYSLKLILLQECSYSIAANELIQMHKIPSQTQWITRSEADVYVNDKIQTFPQIYLNKFNSKGNLLLGGYTDLKLFIDTFKERKLSESDINQFMKKYNWSKKSTLRLIQLINLI